MSIGNLVAMANRIGDFFESLPDEQEAKAGIAQHISKFWAPSMRESLIGKIETPEAAALHSLVKAAIQENTQLLARKA